MNIRNTIIRLGRFRLVYAMLRAGRQAMAHAGHYRSNLQFKRQNPWLALPPFGYMYETFGPSYASFVQSGRGMATLVQQLAQQHLPAGTASPPALLDVGCGVGRIAMHLQPHFAVYGCDIHPGMIASNRRRMPHLGTFQAMPGPLEIPFAGQQFDVALCISIVTHMPLVAVQPFLKGIAQRLRPGGLLVITTQGMGFVPRLAPAERQEHDATGSCVRRIGPPGNRYYSTYLSPTAFQQAIAGLFVVVESQVAEAGSLHAGGRPQQDMYILRRSHHA